MKYTKDNIRDFNLDHIFDCGQCFRWEKQSDGSYIGTAFGKVVKMSFELEGRLTVDNCTEQDFDKLWRPYLDLDTDYGKFKERLTAGDKVMKDAASYGYGIRILKQDFWETVVSFIISQNNNIPRIKGCIEGLCAGFGKKLGEYEGKEYFDIPSPEVMAELSVEDLAPVKLGYRATYLIETARQMLELGGPEAVKTQLLGESDPIEGLRRFCGVGPKVASCISLFGLGRMDAFPIDVWMRRVMNRLYGMDEGDMRAMASYAKEHFGELGGIAQQYLFYYIRGISE